MMLPASSKQLERTAKNPRRLTPLGLPNSLKKAPLARYGFSRLGYFAFALKSIGTDRN
jgi:hypothetical protein